MTYRGQHFSDAADYKLNQEGFSQIPPPSNTDSNNPIDSPRDFTHTKKTDVRSPGPPTLDLKTTVRPPGPSTHQSNFATHPPTWFASDSNAVVYPPAFTNDWEDDGDLAVCPPPSIGSDSTNYIYPACCINFGINIVANPSDPSAHGKKTDVHSPGPQTHEAKTNVRPSDPPTHRPNVATHPPTSFTYDSNAVIYPPAFTNDSDDEADLKVCPPPSIGSDSTNYIYPACPFICGTNVVAHPSDTLAHGKETDIRSPDPPNREVKTVVRPSGPPNHELKTGLRPSGPPNHGRKTDVRSQGPPTLDEKTAVRPPGPPNHQSNVATHPPTWFAYDSNAVVYPPAFSNDSDDEADLKVCPPPSIGSDSTNYIYPACPFIFGTNVVAHPSDPLAHGKGTDIRSPGPPNHEVKTVVRPSGPPNHGRKTDVHSPGPPTLDEKTAVRPRGPPTHQSNVATPPPTWFAYDSNAVVYPPAFSNDSDDDADLKVCPPLSIGSDSTNYIYPACSINFGINIVANPSDPSAHGKKTDVRSAGPPTHDVKPAVRPPGSPTHGKKTDARSSGPPTHRPNVATHPPPSFAYDSNAVIYPPAFANDSDDDADLAVCPPPSIGSDSANYIYPACPFIFGTNTVAHPSDPLAHGKKTDVRSIGPPTHQPNVATHPPPSFAYDSNAVIYPPAFANDWDDDGDLAVCPLPSIGVNSTNIIYPLCPFVSGTNTVAHSPTSFSGNSNIGMHPPAPSYFY